MYQAAILRDRFDQHKDETDMRVATKLLQEGEDEFWESQHPQPYKCKKYFQGICKAYIGNGEKAPHRPPCTLQTMHPVFNPNLHSVQH